MNDGRASSDILVVGAGFAGLYAAMGLRGVVPDGHRVTVVNPESFFQYQPFLPEVASGTIDPRAAVVPLRRVLRHCRLVPHDRVPANVLAAAGRPTVERVVVVGGPAAVSDELAQALTIASKADREAELERIRGLAVEKIAGQFEGRDKEVSGAFRGLTKQLVRQRVLRDHVRIDGRGVRDIRPLVAEVEVVPRVHGSALFERGETQILGVTTLNMLRMEQQLDTLAPETRKRYMHNYNFPPYSTGETGRVGSPKRREIGHGALAERALLPVLPSREDFPYAIRQVSEALGSNGSTSMGSVCASTMSLLNAGVPLKAPVAGIAMG